MVEDPYKRLYNFVTASPKIIYIYGDVSLSISLNLKLAPVPYATLKWPIAKHT